MPADDAIPPAATPVEPPRPPSPGRRPPPLPPRRARSGCLFPLVLIGLFLSLVANVALVFFVIAASAGKFQDDDNGHVRETFYLGDKDADDTVAVVRVDGVISESGIASAVKHLEHAARDKNVKAVVLRVDSPGGTVSASDELYQCVVDVRDNTGRKFTGSAAKPVVASLGSVAASGGYYVAVAASPVYAERTTITGSVGVFAALPNVAELAAHNGVKLELVKAGDIKAAGSFFHALTPEERQTWQDTVDSAYDTFLGVIAKGRPNLPAAKLRTDVVIDRAVSKRDDKGNVVKGDGGKPIEVRYKRVRADGGTFTATQAKEFGMVDDIGDLPAVVKAAAAKAGLGRFRAVTYSKPPTFFDTLMGGSARSTAAERPFGMDQVRSALTPRLWYLTPSADGGILAAGP